MSYSGRCVTVAGPVVWQKRARKQEVLGHGLCPLPPEGAGSTAAILDTTDSSMVPGRRAADGVSATVRHLE
jgi:hypothetical protein